MSQIKFYFERGFLQITFNDLQEAIKKAKELKTKNSIIVIESNKIFYVESPASLMIRSFEKKHLYIEAKK